MSTNNKKSSNFNWNVFALNGQSKKMKQQMLDDVFVIKDMAILGQHTVFFASPNCGKTLITIHQLVHSIHDEKFKAENLMYINADDTYKGLQIKTELAEKFNFQMVAPGHNGFKNDMFVPILDELIKRNEAKNRIIVLDTLKKFTDLMDKGKMSNFSNKVREFTSHGGTVISLAHVNKHKGADGKSIYAGTSDLTDDSDCAYIIDVIDDSDIKVVEFNNIKCRGNVKKTLNFSYDQTKNNYNDLLISVHRVDNTSAGNIKIKNQIKKFKVQHNNTIQLIIDIIKNGTTSQSGIIKDLNSSHGVANKIIREVLLKLDGDIWNHTVGSNNKHIYSLI